MVVEATDKIALEGGKLGYGLIATFTRENPRGAHSKTTVNIHLADHGLGKCVFRTPGNSTDASGVFTFADVTSDDDKTRPMSFRVEPAKNPEPAKK